MFLSGALKVLQSTMPESPGVWKGKWIGVKRGANYAIEAVAD